MVNAAGGLPDGVRDAALVLVMRDLLARISEVVAIEVADVTFFDTTATVLIRRSKTDQEGRGEVRLIGPAATAALKAWISLAAITEGAVFRSLSRSGYLLDRLHVDSIPKILKRLARKAGIDPKGISGHSCRVGMAHDLVAYGCDLAEVMQAGRWKTASMPARYTERLAAKRGAIARLYGLR
jgi:integrase